MANTHFDEQITSQTQDMQDHDVQDIVLDGVKLANAKQKLEALSRFANLRVLTLNSCYISNLDGFPTLPKLERLELCDNQLSDSLDALQEAGLVQLQSLSLAGNKFAKIDALEPLAGLPNLRELDLYNCAVTNEADYRPQLFGMLPSLRSLDNLDADGNEIEGEFIDEDDDDDESDDDEFDDEGEESIIFDDEEDVALLDEGEGESVFDDDEGEEGEEGADPGEETEGDGDDSASAASTDESSSKRQKR